MKKILFISNISKKVGSFSICSIKAAEQCGYEFHMAANWSEASSEQIAEDERIYGVKIFHVDLSRSPYSRQNIRAYRQLVDYIRKEKIDYIHCNTPVGGLLGRLAGKKCGVKKIIYQAHGFHFYKGAPLKNWLFYYPVEKWLAHYTDALITINQEDYELAKQKMKLRNNGQVYFVPGVGIDLEQYEKVQVDREGLRSSLGLRNEDIVCISMGDLVARKNYSVAIESVARCNNPNIHYLICGKGPQLDLLHDRVQELGMESQIHFLGFRTDIRELLQVSDIFLFTTLQEGLPRSMMEAMASGLPCVVSDIRGNRDLISQGNGGYLVSPDDVDGFAEKLQMLAENPRLRKQMQSYNLSRIREFAVEVVEKKILDIYSKVCR